MKFQECPSIPDRIVPSISAHNCGSNCRFSTVSAKRGWRSGGFRQFFISGMFLLIASCSIQAQTALSGDIHAYPFDAAESPYIVSENLTVPSGTECNIPAGCVLLFNPFTGIEVEGTLIVNGTSEQPVVFSSINDQEFNPESPKPANPFDWNGITIAAESHGSSIRHARVGFSVYGIKSRTPYVTLIKVLFSSNGQYHFTIKEKIMNVLEGFPFTYPEEKTAKDTLAPKPHLPEKPGRDPVKTVLRIGTVTLGIAGLAGGAVAYTMMRDADREIQEAAELSVQRDDRRCSSRVRSLWVTDAH